MTKKMAEIRKLVCCYAARPDGRRWTDRHVALCQILDSMDLDRDDWCEAAWNAFEAWCLANGSRADDERDSFCIAEVCRVLDDRFPCE